VELPRLEPLFRQYRDRGFQIVAVESQRDRDRAVQFIAENDLTYTFLENGEGEAEFVADLFKVRSHPTSFLIGPDGKILSVHVGFREGDERKLAAEIERILSL
jgi:peroxiredoxin